MTTRLEENDMTHEELIKHVAGSGIDFDHPALDYVTIQVDRNVWDECQRVAGQPVRVPVTAPQPYDPTASCPACGYALDIHELPNQDAGGVPFWPTSNGGCPANEAEAMLRWGA